MKVSALLAFLTSVTMAYGSNNETNIDSKPFMLTFFSSSPEKSKCDAQVNLLQDSIFDTYLKELMNHAKVQEDDAKCLVVSSFQVTENRLLFGVDDGADDGLHNGFDKMLKSSDNDDRKLQYCTRYICTQAYIVIKAEGCLKYCGYRRTEESEPADQNNQVSTTDNTDRELQYCTRYICTQAYIVIKAEGCLKYCGYRRTEESEPADQNIQVAATDNADRELQYCTRYICTQAYIVIKAEGCLKYCGYRRTEESEPAVQKNQVATTKNADRELQYCTRYICTQAYIVIKAEGCLKYCGYRRTEESEPADQNNQVAATEPADQNNQVAATDNTDRELQYCTRYICTQAYIVIKAEGCLKYCGYRRTEESEPSDQNNQVAATDNADRELQYCTRYICTQAYIVIKAEGCLKYCGYRRTEESEPSDQNNQVATTDNNDRELQYCTRYICTQAYIVIKAEGCLKYCGYRRTMSEEPTKNNLRRRLLHDTDTERALSTELILSSGNSTTIVLSALGHKVADMFYKNIDKMITESDPCNPILKTMSFEVKNINLLN